MRSASALEESTLCDWRQEWPPLPHDWTHLWVPWPKLSERLRCIGLIGTCQRMRSVCPSSGWAVGCGQLQMSMQSVPLRVQWAVGCGHSWRTRPAVVHPAVLDLAVFQGPEWQRHHVSAKQRIFPNEEASATVSFPFSFSSFKSRAEGELSCDMSSKKSD